MDPAGNVAGRAHSRLERGTFAPMSERGDLHHVSTVIDCLEPTALAPFYTPDVAPGPYYGPGYAAPYYGPGYGPGYAAPYYGAYPGYGTPFNPWPANRRARSVGHAPGDTNGF